MAILRLTSRQRLVPGTVVCAVLLVYFLWFNAYTAVADTERQLVARPPSSPAPYTPPVPASASTSTPISTPPSSSSSILSSSSSSTSTSTRSPILLVSAFYPLAKSKHTHDEYRAWLARFLGHIDTDIYFFTTPDLEPLVRAARANLTHSPHTLTINTTYASPLSIPPLTPHAEKYTQMHAWDRERARHAPDLYAVWNAKPWFLIEGLRNANANARTNTQIQTKIKTETNAGAGAEANQDSEGGMYRYAFWTDAGSFRHTHTYRGWPDPARVDEIWERAYARVTAERPPPPPSSTTLTTTTTETETPTPDKLTPTDLIFVPIYEIPAWSPALARWTLPSGPVDLDISEGSFFGGAPPALEWYARVFYRYHDYYIGARPPPPSRVSGVPGPGHPHGRPVVGQNGVEGEGEGGGDPPFYFVGKDQTLINALFMMYPQRFFTVVAPIRAALLPPSTLAPAPFPPLSTLQKDPTRTPTPTPPPDAPSKLTRLRIEATRKFWAAMRGPEGGVCGDEWFYYQFWVAGRGERGGMRGLWGRLRWGEGLGVGRGFVGWVEGVVRGWGDGEGEGKGGEGGEGEREGCGVMPVVTVEAVLRGVLGREWRVPSGLEDR